MQFATTDLGLSNLNLLGVMSVWLTPIWSLAIGATAGLTVIFAVYGALKLVAPKVGAIIEEMALDGLLQPLFYASMIPAGIGLIAFAWAPYKERLLDELGWPLGPDAGVAVGMAGFLIGVFLFYVALRFTAPRVAAIAQTTAKEGLAQLQFWILLAIGVALMLVFIYLPYNTFGEDIKMLKDSGLTLIMVLSILLALWTASVSISDEIEGRTALTVLSKPIGRMQFIIGKFVGILGPVLLMFFVLGLVFLATVSYKVIYDGSESGQLNLGIDDCRVEMLQILPGLALAFMETMVLTAISVAISTRLPMLANLIICCSIYVMGNLIPLLVQSSVGENEFVQFVGQLISTVLPVLEQFNVTASISGGQTVPWSYVAWSLLYCLLYSGFALLGALVFFEDRDLA